MSGVIDLSQTPAPAVVETIDYESILADRKAALVALFPEDEQADIRNTLALESEPLTKAIEENAYRETVLRQRINEAARAVMLPYATGADLDNLATLFDVPRLITKPAEPNATPPVPAVYETDNEFRRRILLSLEGLSVAGPPGAYIYHALSADGRIRDASVDAPEFSNGELLGDGRVAWTISYDAGLDTPRPGDVVISVLSREGDGTPAQNLIDAVHDALYSDNVRPLTDHPIIQPAEIVNYTVAATIYVYDGPDSALVIDDARAQLQQYVDKTHRLGYDVSVSGIYAALHQPGVQRVELTAPAADLTIGARQAGYCTDINLSFGGRDE